MAFLWRLVNVKEAEEKILKLDHFYTSMMLEA